MTGAFLSFPPEAGRLREVAFATYRENPAELS